MRKYKNLLFYIITVAGFSGIIYYIIRKGATLEHGKMTEFVPQLNASTWDQFKDTYSHNVTHPLAILLLQIITIILTARLFGVIFKKIRQPSVIGEIIAGIVLGPSFLGTYFPEFSGFLFPAQSLSNLQFLSQIGLILFMFVVGMELDLNLLRNKAKDAVVVSHASIIFPFTLGIGLAYYIYNSFSPANINFLAFSLFMGIAMSITAFPVLARIVQERGLTKTKLGSIVITCAAADDITAWCILAAVIAIVKAGSIISALFTILMAIAYVIIMLKVIRPFLKRIGEKYSSKETISKPVVAIFFITLLASSYMTEVIGIHALFGAFMAGVIMPSRVNFRSIFIEKVEDVSLVLLLPLFFVFTGLRTQIGLLNDWELWKVCGAIIAVAVIGKFAGGALAARYVGQDWKTSLSIGALMNTRGLMELVVLNIGYDLGVLSPSIFAMMVIMALVTTFMTGPSLDIINWWFKDKKSVKTDPLPKNKPYNILFTFRVPRKGVSLLKLANYFVRNSMQTSRITALHLSASTELNMYNQEEYERESFQPVREQAASLNVPVATMFKPSSQIEHDITQTANLSQTDLLLIGAGSSVFEGSLLGRILGLTTRIINPERLLDTITGKEKLFESTAFDETVKNIMRNTTVPVGVYLDKGLQDLKRVHVFLSSSEDAFLVAHAKQLIYQQEVHIHVIDKAGLQQDDSGKHLSSILKMLTPGPVTIEQQLAVQDPSQELLLISTEAWKNAVDNSAYWLSAAPSVLVMKHA
ncbi:MAG: cation:proton antiporter [Chitinophagaceae bacterium]